MHHDSEPQQLRILVVTEDRALARQCSRFLGTVGYKVFQAAEPQWAIAAAEAEQPHLVLIGSDLAARDGWELLKELHARQSSPEAYTFLMAEEPDDDLVQEAYEHGIDDILLLPLDYGELLARLRAAARVLEYNRRAGRQGPLEVLTGLMSRSALIAQTRRELADRVGSSAPRVACVVLEIDYVNRIHHAHGAAAVESVLKAATVELNKLRSGSEMIGCLSAGRFAAVLPGATDTAAVEWAEHARRALSAARLKFGDTNCQVTASFGVAGCDAAESAEQLLEQASDALSVAQASGRNCVVRFGEIGADDAGLTGNMFERTVARDVMTPCSVLLRADEPVSEGVALFQRTRLEGIPVVDAAGKLVGLLEEQAAATNTAHAVRHVRELMNTDVQSFGEQDTLIALLDFFAHDPRSMAVIVREGRPVGFVTCISLGALLQQVTIDSFAAEAEYNDSSDYLLVPDCCAMECEHTT